MRPFGKASGEQPAWIAEELLVDPETPGGALRVLQALFAWGKQEAGRNGERRCKWAVAIEDLAAAAGIGESTARRAVRWLEARDYMIVFDSKRHDRPNGFSSPYSLFESPEWEPQRRSEASYSGGVILTPPMTPGCQNDTPLVAALIAPGRALKAVDDDDESEGFIHPVTRFSSPGVVMASPSSSKRSGAGTDRGGVKTTPPANDALLADLRANKLAGAAGHLKNWGEERCQRALDWLHDVDRRGERIRNRGGLLRSFIEDDQYHEPGAAPVTGARWAGGVAAGVSVRPEVPPLSPVTSEDCSRWSDVLGLLKDEVARPSFETWLADTTPIGWDSNRTLYLSASRSLAADYLNGRLSTVVARAVAMAWGKELEVEFVGALEGRE